MTVYIDPVIGAALVHLGLPILPALPCPTCGGRGQVADSEFERMATCPRCDLSGVWTPPDSPVPIGVTSAEPKDGQRFASWATYCLSERWFLTPHDRVVPEPRAAHPIVLSSMIGEGTLRPLKVVDFRSRIDGLPGVVEITHGSERRGLRHWFKTTDGIWDWANISSALPFLPGLKPGDTVYLLDGFTASVECPECHGYCCLPIRLGSDGLFGGGGQCPSCLGTGGLSCPFPVDAPDHPCVQP